MKKIGEVQSQMMAANKSKTKMLLLYSLDGDA